MAATVQHVLAVEVFIVTRMQSLDNSTTPLEPHSLCLLKWKNFPFEPHLTTALCQSFDQQRKIAEQQTIDSIPALSQRPLLAPTKVSDGNRPQSLADTGRPGRLGKIRPLLATKQRFYFAEIFPCPNDPKPRGFDALLAAAGKIYHSRSEPKSLGPRRRTKQFVVFVAGHLRDVPQPTGHGRTHELFEGTRPS